MKTLEGTVTVLNVPPYAEDKFIVAKVTYGEAWFWGAWDNEDDAIKIASEFENGIVVRG